MSRVQVKPNIYTQQNDVGNRVAALERVVNQRLSGPLGWAYVDNSISPFIATISASVAINGTGINVTIANPAGAYVRVASTLSAFGTVASCSLKTYLQIDLGTWLLTDYLLGSVFFNNTGEHLALASATRRLGPLAQGTHNFILVANPTGGNSQMDSNDRYSLLVEECP